MKVASVDYNVKYGSAMYFTPVIVFGGMMICITFCGNIAENVMH